MFTLTATLSPLATIVQQWLARATPARAPARSPTEEAAAVRALADTYRESDPSFASDLYAAADRHEFTAGAAV
jgi:hypothetical protein